MSGFSDPAVPWLQLRKAEIKAAFRAPSLSLSQAGGVGGVVRQGSVLQQCWWKESMESFFKQCVFTKPEGKVGEVTQGAAAGGLGIIQVFLQTNQKDAGTWAGYHSEYWTGTVLILLFILSRRLQFLEVHYTSNRCCFCFLCPALVGRRNLDVSYQSRNKKKWIEFVTKVGWPLLIAHGGPKEPSTSPRVRPPRSPLADWAPWCLHPVRGG